MPLTVTKDMDSLQDALANLTREGKRIALVPTMGALHAGHVSLVKQAQELADAVVVSIFVNPTQFGKDEDFGKYPRMLESDIKKVDEAGAAIVYAPEVDDLYPNGYSTRVSTRGLSKILCGAFRPGHFDGVATVVTKLFLRVMPHVAIFGEKDYQQLCVIRRVSEDLDLPIEVVGAPIIRESDGLAMSSRNAYLSREERAIAPKLYEILTSVSGAISSYNVSVKAALEQGVAALTRSGFKVDYLELRAAHSLTALDRPESEARLLVAAWLGKTRLIDNIELE